MSDVDVYAERLLEALPSIVRKAVERRDQFPGFDPERIVEGVVAHAPWTGELRTALSEAREEE